MGKINSACSVRQKNQIQKPKHKNTLHETISCRQETPTTLTRLHNTVDGILHISCHPQLTLCDRKSVHQPCYTTEYRMAVDLRLS